MTGIQETKRFWVFTHRQEVSGTISIIPVTSDASELIPGAGGCLWKVEEAVMGAEEQLKVPKSVVQSPPQQGNVIKIKPLS